MSDVVLVHPYHLTATRHAEPFHPLGLAQLAALLRERGIGVAVADGTFASPAELVETICAHRPRVVGVYVMVTLLDNALRLAAELRRRLPRAALVCGGPLPTLRPERFAGAFDLVFRGEASRSFPAFCRRWLDAGADPRDLDAFVAATPLPGLHRRGTHGLVASPPPESLSERALGALPAPDRDGFDHAAYQRHWRRRTGRAPAGLITSYGCPHDCEFCSRPIFGRRFRRRPLAAVIEEIRGVTALGYDELRLADDSFLLDPRHVRAFCEGLLVSRLGIGWTCLARTDGASEEQAALMRRAGCRRVTFGLESGSDRVLRLMNKRTTVASAEAAVRLFAGAGIETAAYFMVGYPGETLATVEETFAFALSLPLDAVSFTVPYPLPGTPLGARVGVADAERDWAYESENRVLFRSEFDEAHLRRRIEETHARFDERRAARAR